MVPANKVVITFQLLWNFIRRPFYSMDLLKQRPVLSWKPCEELVLTVESLNDLNVNPDYEGSAEVMLYLQGR